jgi:predicted nuclease of predicted toxin-antitoxin system
MYPAVLALFFTGFGLSSMLRVCTIGTADAPDTEIMDYAHTHGYTVFTHDLDFGAILA